jgi:hypothetical protein
MRSRTRGVKRHPEGAGESRASGALPANMLPKV